MKTLRAGLLASLSVLSLAAPAFAQDAPPAPADEVDPNAPQIIVTGTRAANRTVQDSPVPVDVLSNQALTTSGSGETNKILNKLVPSFNFPQPAINDGTDAIRPATLRGLSPDQVLVLVNGRRRHVSALLNINGSVGRGAAAVDMNSIPTIALDRIEVLRDGASSQYGSDAIAGVINLRLKTANHGGRFTVSYGKYDTTLDGVANVTGLQTTAGQPFFDPADVAAVSANFPAAASRYLAANTDGERHASDGATYTVSGNVGLPFFGNDEGFINVTAEYRHRGYTNRQGFDLRPNYNRPTAAFDARELTFNRLEYRFGDPESEDYILFLNSGVPLGDSLELFAYGSFNQRDSLSAANYRQQSAATNRDYSVLAPGQTPNTTNFVPLTADGFLPFIQSDLTDYAGTVGVRTTGGDWRAEFAYGYGHNSFDYRVENSLNVSYGPGSQRVFDAGGLRYGQHLVTADISRDFDWGTAKPVTLSFGAEFRAERFAERPGELASYAPGQFFRASILNTTAVNCTAQGGVFAGTTCSFPGRAAAVGAQGFPGIPVASTTNVTRNNVAGYVELDTDLFDKFSVTAAGRFEHYSDFGNTLTGKLAARYEFVPGFAIRGSISNGFRAPSLHQQFFTTTSTNIIGGQLVDVSTVAVASPVAVALGSKPLKPEKSLNFSGGFTANPLSGLTLTVDYYNIKITDRVVLTENLGAAGAGTAAQNTAVKAVLDANGFASVGAARFFINGLDTRTQGVDAVLNWRLPIDGFGKWTLTAAYNYNKTKILAYHNDLGPLATIPGLALFGRIESIRFTQGQPRDKIVLSLDGDVGMFGFGARTTRYGKVVSPGATAPLAPNAASLTAFGPDDVFLSPKWITDFELRFKPIKRITLTAGVDNAFDIYPDRSPFGPRPTSVGGQYPVTQQFLPYSTFSPFGFNGRFLYGRVAVDF